VKVTLINKSHHPLPAYQTAGASGMDVYAFLPSGDVALAPMQRVLIPTGLYAAIPEGFEAQIRPRSGMAIQKGITCLNTPGTIDSDYRGEIKVMLVNLSDQVQEIKDGDRIAQMIVCAYERVSWQLVDELDASTRGEGGFGSTG
jgi:dUTP pyrophosphatase